MLRKGFATKPLAALLLVLLTGCVKHVQRGDDSYCVRATRDRRQKECKDTVYIGKQPFNELCRADRKGGASCVYFTLGDTRIDDLPMKP